MKKTLISASLIAGFLAGATALSVLADTTWTAPTAPPPGNNVAAPINTGIIGQAKTGLLGLASLLYLPVGQSSVIPGSVLVASSTGDGLVSWGSASAIPNGLVVIDSSQNWTVPAGVTKIRVRAWGGGGAGGGGSGHTGPGGGGGGGGYGESILSVTPGTVYSVTIGAGGVGCCVSSGGNGGPGGAGGNTIFGPITAFGGAGAQSDAQADAAPPIRAPGGTASGAQIIMIGGYGSAGGDHSWNPFGAASPEGGPGGAGGTNDGTTAGTGGFGQVPGGGGGGSASQPTNGGGGGHGRVIIEY